MVIATVELNRFKECLGDFNKDSTQINREPSHFSLETPKKYGLGTALRLQEAVCIDSRIETCDERQVY